VLDEPRTLKEGIRVVVADDHAMVRAGLRLIIERHPGIRVIGEAADGAETWSQTSALRPDVVVLDLSMPRTDAMATIRRIVQSGAGTSVVALGLGDGNVYAQAATAAGALAYVAKSSPERELLAAIRAAAKGDPYLDAAVRRRPQHAARGGHHTPLSPRETEALRLLALGYSNRQAAERMRVSAKTIETFRARLSRKIGADGRPALVRFALSTGLVSPEDATLDVEEDPPR